MVVEKNVNTVEDRLDKALEGCLALTIAGALASLFRVAVALTLGFPLMLSLGMVHGQWPAVPPAGYWATAGVVFLVRTGLDLLTDVIKAPHR